MPDSRLPRWAQVLRVIVLVLYGYGMAFLVGLGDATQPSTVIREVTTQYTPTGAYVALALSVVGVAGVMLHRWRWEWLAASVLLFALTARAVPVWASLDTNPDRLSAAAGMTAAAGLMFYRAVDLWVFACRTGHLARKRRVARGHQGEL